MKSSVFQSSLAVVLAFLLTISSLAQSGRPTQNVPVKEAPKKTQPPEPERQEPPAAKAEAPDPDAIKLDATLVTVPVVASDRNGLYIPDLKAEEFTIFEDGIKQEVAYFATVKEPFHVVLMLDTSASTQDKLAQIQRAAIAFVEQLQSVDRVSVISFDEQIQTLIGFTNDRAALRRAIETTRPGQGTHLYDAFHQAMLALSRVRRDRRAIVIFTDGVDMYSEAFHYDENLREVEESGVIVYPIRYDTRAEVEALLRQQRNRGPLPDIGVILKRPPIGTTPPTTPGGRSPIPDDRTGGRIPGGGLPIPPVILNRPPYPNDPRVPNPPTLAIRTTPEIATPIRMIRTIRRIAIRTTRMIRLNHAAGDPMTQPRRCSIAFTELPINI
jgi:Mg-chelatase subunit ChlD